MQFKKRIFLVTLAVAAIIFLLGIFMGEKLDEWRVVESDLLIEEAFLDSESFVVESQFLETFGAESCETLEPRLRSLSRSLFKTGTLLQDFDEKKMSNLGQYDDLKRKHYLNQMKAILLNKQLQEDCGTENKVVLFFFKVDDADSQIQGEVLDAFVRIVNDSHVFSFDVDFDEPSVEVMKTHFNITVSPTLLLNFEYKMEELTYVGDVLAYYDLE